MPWIFMLLMFLSTCPNFAALSWLYASATFKLFVWDMGELGKKKIDGKGKINGEYIISQHTPKT